MPTVRTGDFDTHYEESGAGPPVVLLHASLMDHGCWRGQVEALARGHRVIRYDLRGHGRSRDSAGRPFTVGTLADDLGALIDGLGLDRPVVIGWSLGGMVAMTYAARHPEKVAGLATLGAPTPAILSFAERMQRVIMPRVILGPAPLLGYARIKRMILRIQARVHGQEAMGTFRPEDLPDMTTAEFVRSVKAFSGFHRIPVDLAALRMPVLALYGANEPPFVRAHAERIRAAAPQTRVLAVERAGHACLLDQPAAVAEALEAFVAGGQPPLRSR